MYQRDVVILRGLPGAGKSTWAGRQNLGNCNPIICSADEYFMNAKSEYVYEAKKVAAAHVACYKKFVQACTVLAESQSDLVIVDNTNTLAHEIAPYYMHALSVGMKVQVFEFWCTIQESVARNMHLVPIKAITALKNNLNIPLPRYWHVEKIFLRMED